MPEMQGQGGRHRRCGLDVYAEGGRVRRPGRGSWPGRAVGEVIMQVLREILRVARQLLRYAGQLLLSALRLFRLARRIRRNTAAWPTLHQQPGPAMPLPA